MQMYKKIIKASMKYHLFLKNNKKSNKMYGAMLKKDAGGIEKM